MHVHDCANDERSEQDSQVARAKGSPSTTQATTRAKQDPEGIPHLDDVHASLAVAIIESSTDGSLSNDEVVGVTRNVLGQRDQGSAEIGWARGFRDLLQKTNADLHQAYLTGTEDAAPSAFQRFVVRCLRSDEAHGQLRKHWLGSIALPKLAAFNAIVAAMTSPAPKWGLVTSKHADLFHYYLLEQVFDDLSIGLFWRPPTDASRAALALISRHCQNLLTDLGAESSGGGEESLPSLEPRANQLDVFTCTDSPLARVKILNHYYEDDPLERAMVLQTSVDSCLEQHRRACGKLAEHDSLARPMIVRGLFSRYSSVRRLITGSFDHTSPVVCARLGGESVLVTPSIYSMVGVGVSCGLVSAGVLDSSNEALIERISERLARIIRTYNDLGVSMAEHEPTRATFCQRLRELSRIQEASGTEIYRLIGSVATSTDHRLAKDARQGENNIALEALPFATASEMSLGSAADTLIERIHALATLFEADKRDFEFGLRELKSTGRDGTWLARLLQTWEQFHRRLYSAHADSFWGDYTTSDAGFY
jgi:hypothetical protein